MASASVQAEQPLGFTVKRSVPVDTSARLNILGDFVRDSSGRIMMDLNYASALQACKSKGSRTPKARELAEHATKKCQSVDGNLACPALIEVSDYDKNNFPEGFEKADFNLISTLELDNRIDQFFYSNKQYRVPTDSDGVYTLFSSSRYSGNPGEFRVAFDLENGKFTSAYKDFVIYQGAARCVE